MAEELMNQQPINGGVDQSRAAADLGLPEFGEGASEAEMRMAIDGAFNKLGEKESEVFSSKMSIDNKIKSLKIEFLNKLFKMLMEIGIDPGNPDSMRQFLSKLEQRDPDLVILFESLLNGMDPEPQRKETSPELEAAASAGSLNINGNSVAIPEVPEQVAAAEEPMAPLEQME